MTYFFTDQSGLTGFYELSKALGGADRKLPLLPPVQRGVYAVQNKSAAPRIKVGADVLPWWPVRGVYLLLESGATPPADLVDVDGVAGVWSVASQDVDARLASAPRGPVAHLLLPRRRPGRHGGAACGPSWRTAGNRPASSRCWPRRFIPSCRMSGIAMCRRGFGCASA